MKLHGLLPLIVLLAGCGGGGGAPSIKGTFLLPRNHTYQGTYTRTTSGTDIGLTAPISGAATITTNATYRLEAIAAGQDDLITQLDPFNGVDSSYLYLQSVDSDGVPRLIQTTGTTLVSQSGNQITFTFVTKVNATDVSYAVTLAK